MKIDLTTAPSGMEAKAATWFGNKPATSQPEKRDRPAYKPQVYAKPDPPTPQPEKVTQRPRAGSNYAPAMSKNADFTADQRAIAYRHAMKAFARDLPDPRSYARYMPSWAAEALVTAVFHKPTTTWRLHPSHMHRLPELRSMGLVNYGNNPIICGFSLDVRQALLAIGEMD
jgi:hypothetical protein